MIGNEVTTSIGHFNVFPLPREGKLPDWRAPTWASIGRTIAEASGGGDPAIILNHARDIHSKFRPFDPSRHISVTGEDLEGWVLPANAMEVINSGATQTDPLLLFRDWFGMLNRGTFLTPVGSSDSHDVSRYIVGQGRTYIRADGKDPGRIDVAKAVRSFREGRVLVSYGLVADITVNGRFGPGDFVTGAKAGGQKDELEVAVRVLGPEWTKAKHVTLYANGVAIKEADIATPAGKPEPAGVKWQTTWRIPRPKHDVWLAVIATGPGVQEPYWLMSKPYQPTSPKWGEGYALGASGAIRVDADGSGKFESAYEYGQRIVKDADGDVAKVVAGLAEYDQATAAQAAGLFRVASPDGFEAKLRAAVKDAGPAAKAGFEQFLAAWAESQAAKAAKAPRPASGG